LATGGQNQSHQRHGQRDTERPHSASAGAKPGKSSHDFHGSEDLRVRC
jgi:hypothetical protein